MIIRTVDWDLRYTMRRKYGFTAGIVYAQSATHWVHSDNNVTTSLAPACMNRTRVKLWAYRQFGNPAVILDGEISAPKGCEWFAGRTSEDEYTVAFKNPKLRNLALYM